MNFDGFPPFYEALIVGRIYVNSQITGTLAAPSTSTAVAVLPVHSGPGGSPTIWVLFTAYVNIDLATPHVKTRTYVQQGFLDVRVTFISECMLIV